MTYDMTRYTLRHPKYLVIFIMIFIRNNALFFIIIIVNCSFIKIKIY